MEYEIRTCKNYHIYGKSNKKNLFDAFVRALVDISLKFWQSVKFLVHFPCSLKPSFDAENVEIVKKVIKILLTWPKALLANWSKGVEFYTSAWDMRAAFGVGVGFDRW